MSYIWRKITGMSSFLVLIRFPNLLIIAFTQYMMRYAVVRPVVQSCGLDLQLSGFTFFCLVFSTMCTAAAGYAINDYFDIKTDRINRPNEVVVGKSISRRGAMMTHIILCASGIITGGYVTWKSGIPELVLIYIVVAGMLWLYSTTYKQQFLIGNVIVALFSGLVPMMVLLDLPPVYKAAGPAAPVNLNDAAIWISGVAVFAFLTTLSREIIKDAEDFEGDTAFGCRSLPIVLGDKCTKAVIICINAVVAGMLAFLLFTVLRKIGPGYFSLVYVVLLLIVPIVWLSRMTYKAETSNDYRRIGNGMKLVMLAGIAYSVVIWLSV